jgi:hypothetical protein
VFDFPNNNRLEITNFPRELEAGILTAERIDG